ncbi:MAG TPA: hypothetical protein VGJ54_11085 [Streptosporangiaceae bacterium]|jgi:hypothetical protein
MGDAEETEPLPTAALCLIACRIIRAVRAAQAAGQHPRRAVGEVLNSGLPLHSWVNVEKGSFEGDLPQLITVLAVLAAAGMSNEDLDRAEQAAMDMP